jgi:hypothetical protein
MYYHNTLLSYKKIARRRAPDHNTTPIIRSGAKTTMSTVAEREREARIAANKAKLAVRLGMHVII